MTMVPEVIGTPGVPGAVPEGGEIQATGSLWRIMLRTFVQNKLAVIGLGIIVFLLLFCFVGPLVYHTNQINTELLASNLGPSKKYPLGTDHLGYNILGRLMVGGQSSIEIGMAAAVAAMVFGVLWGAVAGYAGRFMDAMMMRLVDVFLSLPVIMVLILLGSMFTPNLWTMILIIAVFAWLVPARLVRGETLSLRTREYVQAVKVMGGGSRRVVLRHLVPNAIGVIIVQGTFAVADAILVFAILSYLGLGMPPPAASWGDMLSNGTTYISDGYWWEIYPAGIAIILIVIAFNFVGDALRDALDVRLRQR